jgi:hypothetical protein
MDVDFDATRRRRNATLIWLPPTSVSSRTSTPLRPSAKKESIVLRDGLSGARFLNLKKTNFKASKKYLDVDNFIHYDCTKF